MSPTGCCEPFKNSTHRRYAIFARRSGGISTPYGNCSKAPNVSICYAKLSDVVMRWAIRGEERAHRQVGPLIDRRGVGWFARAEEHGSVERVGHDQPIEVRRRPGRVGEVE